MDWFFLVYVIVSILSTKKNMKLKREIVEYSINLKQKKIK